MGNHDLRHVTGADQRTAGRALRATARRRDQARLDLPEDRDPIGSLAAQNRTRIPELLSVRRERMSESPFAFYRGAAAVMAADLANCPSTGHTVQLCGDAHLSNFGVFAGRDRDLVFDLNDFDETAVGPWEWDLKRLVTSVVILGEELGVSRTRTRRAAVATAGTYRRVIDAMAERSVTDRFFSVISESTVRELTKDAKPAQLRRGDAFLAKARSNTSVRALGKLAVREADGNYRIQEQPPLIVHLPEFDRDLGRSLFEQYLTTVSEDIGAVLACLRVQDVVVKVVGVGSVGTRCLLALLADPDGNPLFLQIKEADASVLEAWAGAAGWDSHSHRVVAGQRILQATGDPFLGWFTGAAGVDFYVRQFRDMKGSVDVTTLGGKRALESYGRLCAAALARAHSRSGTPAVIAGYLGGADSGGHADEAFADFGFDYAEVNRRDHAALLAASAAAWNPVATAASPPSDQGSLAKLAPTPSTAVNSASAVPPSR